MAVASPALSDLNQSVEELRVENSRLSGETFRLQRELRESESWGLKLGTTYLRDFKIKLEDEQAKRASAETELALVKEQLAALRYSKDDLHSRVAGDNREIMLLKHALSDAENQIEKYRSKYQIEVSARQILERNLDETKNSVCELTITKHELTRMLELRQTRLSEAQSALEDTQAEIKRFQVDLAEAGQTRTRTVQEYSAEKQLRTEYRDALDESNAKLRAAKQELESRNQDCERLQRQVSSSASLVAQEEVRHSKTRGELDAANRQILSEQRAKETCDDRIKELGSLIERMTADHEATVSAMDEDVKLLQEQLRERQQEFDECKDEHDSVHRTLKQDHHTIEEELQLVKEDYDEASHQLRVGTAELEDVRLKVTQLSLDVAIEKRDKEEALEELAETKNALDQERKVKDDLRMRLFERISGLEAQVNISQEALNESVDTENEKVRLTEEKRHVEVKAQELEEEIASAMDTKATLEGELKRTQLSLDSEKAEVLRLSEANRALESDLYRAQLGETTTVTRIIELEDELSKATAQLAKMKEGDDS